MRPRRGYSDDEVDAAVLSDQLRRHQERRNDPRWQLVDDEFSDVFGPTWRLADPRASAARDGGEAMTHFVVLVIGDDVEGQLAPFHEFECTGVNDQYVIDVDKTSETLAEYERYKDDHDYPTFRAFLEGWYGADKIVEHGQEPDRNGEHKYGWVRVDAAGNAVEYIDRTNPNKKWDWWSVGGRWCDFFLLREGESGKRGSVGLMGQARRARVLTEERAMKRVHADVAKKGQIDWEGMAAEAMRNAERNYDEFLAKIGKSSPGHEAYFFDIQMRPEVKARLDAMSDREQSRAEYQRLTLADFETKDEHAHRCARRAGITRAIVSEGQWVERGEAHWFGVFDEKVDTDEWDRRYWELIGSLDDDVTLTIVDCHI